MLQATYDELGRQLTSTAVEPYPITQSLIGRYTWDDASNQTHSTSPAGHTPSAAYNPAGQVKSGRPQDPGGRNAQAKVDGVGHLDKRKTVSSS
jgi:YD repeat-containing protein